MIAGLLDSSILIDALRSYIPAEQWLLTQTDLGASQSTILELLQGARTKLDQQKTLRRLRLFQIVDTTPADLAWAIIQLERYGLSHNVGAMDCLIAASAYRLQVPLYTRNLKHFMPLLGGLAQEPYSPTPPS